MNTRPRRMRWAVGVASVSAVSGDGVIEAIELPDHEFAMGLQ